MVSQATRLAAKLPGYQQTLSDKIESLRGLMGGSLFGLVYLLTLQGEEKFIKELSPPVGQPAPPDQPTMPNPCEGVPKNPLCPKGNI